jgi:hypothetical protein
LTLSSKHTIDLDNEIQRILTLSDKNQPVIKKEVENPYKHNVYELMRERTLEVGGNLEGLWDDYLQDGAKKTPTFPVVDLLAKSNILPHHVPILISAWQSKLNEYHLVQSGKDDSLNEAYARFTKTQIKNIIGTIEQIISDLNSYISVKKAGRKPRTKKLISVDKLVRKLKYQKIYKDEALGLNLVSLSPTKLHGCSEAWAYDTKKRKLYHFVADEYSKSIGVKGNTLIGFCTKQSEIKTLRKPAEQLKEIMGSKPSARKFFKEIKAVSTTPNGKFNSSIIILKAF